MAGSVHRDKRNGNWFYMLEIGIDEEGKRKQKKKSGFKTKTEAKKVLVEAENALNNGNYFEPSKLLYKNFLMDWLDSKRNSAKKQTVSNYDTILRSRIVPALGNIPLSRLNASMIQKFINNMRDDNLSDSFLRKVFDIINNSLSKAEQWGLIPKNPASLIEKPRVGRKELQVWSSEDVRKFLHISRQNRLYIAFLLAIITGMRQGEILGLRWKDIDFDKKVLFVRQILSHDGKEFQSEAKTKSSIRAIDLPSDTIEALRKHKRLIVEEKLQAGSLYSDSDLVVCTTLGTKVIPRNLSRSWYSLMKKAGLPKIRFHDLRHTHASLLLQQGVHIKVIAERLGHSTTRMTLDTYSHLLPSMQRQAAEKIGEALFA